MKMSLFKKTKGYLFFLLLFCLFSMTANAKKDNGLSTTQVVQRTLSAISHCFHYKVVGLCFWLDCHAGICAINTTPKVEHYLPDAVVSVFRDRKTNPWDYGRHVIDPPAYTLGDTQVKSIMGFHMGYGNAQAATAFDYDNHFKEVDIVGNPALPIFHSLQTFVLPSTAQPFVPYYLSLADSYAWRSPLIEMMLYPQRLVPGVHIVGSLMNNWGSVYPRTGFLIQPADAKAAAVMAQRAADIATRTMQPHVYQYLSSECGTQCQASEVKENDPDTQWQMIYPNVETACTVFGENDLTRPTPWNSEAAQKGKGNYVWILWRHYRGCVQGKGQYISSFDFN